MNIEFKPFEAKNLEAVVHHDDEPYCLGLLACENDPAGNTGWIFTPYEDVWFAASELRQIADKLEELNAT